MSDIEIQIDNRPYTPDIFIKNNVYNTADVTNKSTYIAADTNIFIFNLNSKYNSLTNKYNDPLYMLYGVETPANIPYLFPPLYFYNKIDSNSSPYMITYSTNLLTENIITLLQNIGYSQTDIVYTQPPIANQFDTTFYTQFYYQEITVTDSVSTIKRNIIYMYFAVNSINSDIYNNLNKYNSTVFYNSKLWNVIIYPFINTEIIPYSSLNINYNYDITSLKKSKSKNIIRTIDFNDRDIIKYVDKIAYKYFENKDNTAIQNNKLDLIQNYSRYIKNYENYIKDNSNKQNIMISVNEISRIYYNDTESNNQNSYTTTQLNFSNINNNNTYSNEENKYSFSGNNKFAILNLDRDNTYSCYNYDITNMSSIYQQCKNYYVDCYYDIINNVGINSMTVINCYLYKILILIDPKIINANYLVQNTVSLKINDLFELNNKLEFGTFLNKIKLNIIGTIRHTDTYYINKYKISYSTIVNDISYEYIIILSIAFYNSNYINITDTSITSTADDLGFINYTNLEQEVDLNPIIYNISNNLSIYENLNLLNFWDLKKYNFLIDYQFFSPYKNRNNTMSIKNFYFDISNCITPLKNKSGKFYNNLLNILISKINNFIKNIINISDNFLSLKYNSDTIKTETLISILLDNNIDNKYIYDYTYLPSIQLDPIYSLLPINKYKNFIEIPNSNFKALPAGYYKIINYTNLYPIKDLISPIDDSLVQSIKTTEEFLKYKFCLMIRLPDNLNIDDEFFVNNSTTTNFWTPDNYSFNNGDNTTYIFLVLLNYMNTPYVNSQNIIYGIQLFDYYNYINQENIYNTNNKTIVNLYINNYLNLYQINMFIETYNFFDEESNLIFNVDNTMLKLHNQTFLQQIVYYDFQRFLNSFNFQDITNQYNLYNPLITSKLYLNKICLTMIKYNIKRFILVDNLKKIIILLKRCLSYLCIIKNNKIISPDKNNSYLINLVFYNISTIKQFDQINYDLNITYCISGYITKNSLVSLSNILIENNLENISNYIIKTKYLINYYLKKISLVEPTIINSSNLDYINFCNTNNFNFDIYFYNEVIDNLVIDELENDIYNFENNTSIAIFNGFNINLEKRDFLLQQIGCFINVILNNSTKIDELLNLVKLIYHAPVDPLIPLNLNNLVVKNYFIYNNAYYNTNINVATFDIINFFNDIITIVNSFSTSIIPSVALTYQNLIAQNILIYLSQSIINFQDINNKIISIYKYIYNIPSIPGLPQLDIFDNAEIANFYKLLETFKSNYLNVFRLLKEQDVQMFQEYNLTNNFLDLYIFSIEEFLLYAQLKVDFSNSLLLKEGVYIYDDLLKIMTIENAQKYINLLIKSIDDVLVKKDYNTISRYIEAIRLKLAQERLGNLVFMDILNNKKIINYGGSDVISYQDLNIVKINLDYSSFNFNPYILDIIKKVNIINYDIYDYYYNTTDIDFYKQLINYNYLPISYLYINIDNSLISS
jgi:hypothetical protein